MDDVKKRFIFFKIHILKFSILLVFFVGLFFLMFHIYYYKGEFRYDIDFLEFLLVGFSFYSYKNISEKNYRVYAVFEFLLLFLTMVVLSLVYATNVYLPIWMFGTLIVFALCTDLSVGITFLIISMIVFDYIFFNRLDINAFLTLNFQFIAYFAFGLILIKTIKKLQEKTYLYEEFLYKSSFTDPLTKLYNRKYFLDMANLLLEKAQRNRSNVLFLMLDIDYFKNINDSCGHPVGDKVLIMVADEIKNSLRKSDLLARIGGEEFAVLIDSYSYKYDIAEKIRKNIEKIIIKIENCNVNLTISIGGVVSSNVYDLEYLYKIADNALYEAKKERNKTVIIKDL